MSLLTVDNLTVRFGSTAVVDDVGFGIERGESLGLVGESGSGKTQTALALMGLTARNGVVSGSVEFDGRQVVGAPQKALRELRARRIGMVFQDPKSALNPYRRIGDQLGYVLDRHRLARGAERERRVLESLERTGLPDPRRQAASYPHELSGGMRQRAMLAAALIAEPELLIADEPTTAIDATLQLQILKLLRDAREQTGVALLLITHDLGVIAGNCDRMVVLDSGRVVESGPTAEVFARPGAEQTRVLLDAVRDDRRLAPNMHSETRSPVLEVRELSVSYDVPRRDSLWGRQNLTAVKPIDLDLRPGETLGVVGESGCGKTSLIRAILGLEPARTGNVAVFGNRLAVDLRARSVQERCKMQLVFQDPVSSLDPAMRVARSIGEPLGVHAPELSAVEHAERVTKMAERVGLGEDVLRRYPHQLSGGQAQRVAIARALIQKPAILVCDEAVASLDSSVRRGVLELLAEEQRRTALAIIFISHDLGVVRQICHRILVMYMGHAVELADSDVLFSAPRHPYTRALIDAIPVADPGAAVPDPPVLGEAPSLLDPPPGCCFHPRCSFADKRCTAAPPALERIGRSEVACVRAAEIE